MATLSLWQQLKQLVSFDAQLEKIQIKIKIIKEKIIEDKKVLPELQNSIDEIKQECTDAKKQVDLQELNAKDLKTRETAKREAIDKIHNQKEYAALEKELQSITAEVLEQEDLLVSAWHNLELAQNKEQTEVGTIQEKINALEKDITEKEEKIKALEKEIKTIKAEKSEKANDISPEWLDRYQAMRKRVSDPIVPVINSSCSACYYTVPAQDMTRLKRSAILPCRSCYRFLYYDLEEEKDSKSTSF